jgi:hypothetical protein
MHTLLYFFLPHILQVREQFVTQEAFNYTMEQHLLGQHPVVLVLIGILLQQQLSPTAPTVNPEHSPHG